MPSQQLTSVKTFERKFKRCRETVDPCAAKSVETAFYSQPLPSSDANGMLSRVLNHVGQEVLEPEMSATLDARPISKLEGPTGDVGNVSYEQQKNTNRHSKRWVKEAFEHRPENAEKQATCRYCHKVRSTLNPTRQKEHLLNKKECQFLQSEDARVSTDPEVQSILAGGSLHPAPRRPKSDRDLGGGGEHYVLLI